MINKKTFTVKDESGTELELCVRRPTAEVRSKAQLIYNKAFREAIDSGSILHRQLSEYATKLGLWSPEKDQEVESLQEQLRLAEIKLRGGANSFDTKKEASDHAFEMRKLRWKLINVQNSKNNLYPVTAESYADEAREKYFVSQLTLTGQGKPFFKSYDDYVSQSENEVGLAARSAYLELVYSDLDDVGKDWPENKWLFDNKYIDDKMRPVDSNGRLIDVETGKFINENGQYVTQDNRLCDRDGHLLTDDGSYLVDYKEFE